MSSIIFEEQVKLLIKCLPVIYTENNFALKGGTAINLFIRDLPRLSVDIDLNWLALSDRESSLEGISNSLKNIEKKLLSITEIIRVNPIISKENKYKKLNVYTNNASIKIEPNEILRGYILPFQDHRIYKKARDSFGMDAEMRLLSIEEIYAGKFCAALDRQHPRDLFDVKFFLENEKISDSLMNCFVIMLLQHNRPPDELLNPTELNQKQLFEKEFSGMTEVDVTWNQLSEARKILIKEINKNLTESHRNFIYSFYNLKPKWNLLPSKNLENFPAIKWKLKNIETMKKEKYNKYLQKLKNELEK
jgi:predicted nucleotidyltransferase component of viral defense system